MNDSSICLHTWLSQFSVYLSEEHSNTHRCLSTSDKLSDPCDHGATLSLPAVSITSDLHALVTKMSILPWRFVGQWWGVTRVSWSKTNGPRTITTHLTKTTHTQVYTHAHTHTYTRTHALMCLFGELRYYAAHRPPRAINFGEIHWVSLKAYLAGKMWSQLFNLLPVCV